MININREEVIWAAGLFEGEGCISENTIQRLYGTAKVPKAQLGTSDEDVIRRFYKAVGELGSVSGPYKGHKGTGKMMWRWSIHTFEHTQAIIAMFWPWLGERRRARAIEVLKNSTPKCKSWGEVTHCYRGHEYNEENTYIGPNGIRRCRPCNTINQRNYYNRKQVNKNA